MILRKQFISDAVRGSASFLTPGGTVPTGGVVGTNNGSLDLPAMGVGPLWGTGYLAGNPALLVMNLGNTEAWVALWPAGTTPTSGPVPGGNTLVIPVGQSRIVLEAESYGGLAYSAGPIRLVPGSVSYVADLSPNDSSAVVAA